jgi:O-antigen/teichoic acid export membrane protein
MVKPASSPYTAANLKSGALHYLGGRIASAAATFAAVLLLARYTSVQTYAAFTALTGMASLAVVLAELGLERALGRFIPDGMLHAGRRAVLRLVAAATLVRLAMALALAAAIAAGWATLRQVLGGAALGAFPLELVPFIAAACLFQHFSVVMQSMMMQKQLTRVMMIQWSMRILLIAAALLATSSIPLSWALWIMTVPELCCAAAFVLVLRRRLGGQGHADEDPHDPDWRALARVARDNYGYAVLAAPPQGFSMRLFAAALLPTEFVAAFGFFLTLVERGRQFVPVYFLYNLMEPMLVATYLQGRNFAALNARVQTLYKLNSLALLPAVAVLAVVGDAVVGLLAGGRYVGHAWVLCVVVAQVLVGAQALLLQLVLNASGHSRLLVRGAACALGALAALLLCAWMLRPALLVFADIVFTVANCAFIVRALARAGLAYGLPWRHLGGAALAAAAAVALGWAARLALFPPASVPNTAAAAAVGAAVVACYLAALWRVRPVDAGDIVLVRALRRS